MFERFTAQARQVVTLAHDEARALKHNYIGMEHLLLALFRVEDHRTRQLLDSLGMTVEDARARVVRVKGEGDEVVSGQIPLTPRAKKALELALRESLAHGDNYIGPEHILLGLVRSTGVKGRVDDFEADAEMIREGVRRILSGPSDQPESGLRATGSIVVTHGAPRKLLTGWLLFAVALGLGILIGWAIWGH